MAGLAGPVDVDMNIGVIVRGTGEERQPRPAHAGTGQVGQRVAGFRVGGAHGVGSGTR